MRRVYDNFLHTEDFNTLVEGITDQSFPWHARLGAANAEDKEPAFSNVLWAEFGPTCQQIELVMPILKKLKLTCVVRVKANLDLPNKNGKVLEPESFHVDTTVHPPGLWTMVLYLNDCNGATIFEKDMAPVRSKANRAVIFPSHMRHSGCHQTDTPFRYVININFVAEKVPEGGREF
tara:strand:+ start:1517 stop:2047 length:531 start_codon:yes stop_codon:yes gene_type:complete